MRREIAAKSIAAHMSSRSSTTDMTDHVGKTPKMMTQQMMYLPCKVMKKVKNTRGKVNTRRV